jgi:hypothetical protein
MTHVMEAKTSCNEQPQPGSWGPRWAERGSGVSRQIRRDQIEPARKHTLRQWASVAQVTKVSDRRGGRIGREGNYRERIKSPLSALPLWRRPFSAQSCRNQTFKSIGKTKIDFGTRTVSPIAF